MKIHDTLLGFVVKETLNGLDVYEDGEFVCELTNKTLAHYTYNGKVDDDKLETDIKEEIDCQDFLANMNGMY